MKGIYQYKDLKTDEIVYVGKDSRIDINKRHKQHLQQSLYDAQQINRVIQNNPDRYEYSVLYCSDDVSDDDLNMLEMSFIERYNPKFNFTKGGDGSAGFKMSDESKRKISESKKGKHHTKEHKQKISESMKGRMFSHEHKQKLSESLKGKPKSEKHKEKISNGLKKNYGRIIDAGFTNGKKMYALIFNGKRLKRSHYPDKLLKWFKENYPNEKIMEE